MNRTVKDYNFQWMRKSINSHCHACITTRVMGLSSSKDRMIVAWVVLTQCQRVMDRQTDKWTDLW